RPPPRSALFPYTTLFRSRLELSQSAVSQAIANLEHRLGAVLLRRGNPPQLTEAGIRLLRFVETVMHEEREALADIAQIKSGALRSEEHTSELQSRENLVC